MLDALCEHLLEEPGLYQSEMILFLMDEFNVLVTVSSIGRALRSRGWTKKQIRRIANRRNADLRNHYLYQISSLSPEHFVFVDESGCDKRIGFRHPMFLAWRQKTTADLLWVTAGPGCGKSVLSRALVDEGSLCSDKSDTKTALICYFFFKDDEENGSVINALRSVLNQLFLQKPWLIPHTESDGQVSKPWWQVYKPQHVPFEILWDILIKAVDANAGPVICVLDALDECEPSKRKSLIKHISKFYRDSTTTGSKLKFILTSRPFHELEIEFTVDDLPSIHLDGNEMSETISEEIDFVISHEISRIGKDRQPPLVAFM